MSVSKASPHGEMDQTYSRLGKEGFAAAVAKRETAKEACDETGVRNGRLRPGGRSGTGHRGPDRQARTLAGPGRSGARL